MRSSGPKDLIRHGYRKMGTDRVDHRGLLADEEIARAMEHQTALLLGRLDRNKPHVCPGNQGGRQPSAEAPLRPGVLPEAAVVPGWY
jgi:hypothetical protein